MANTTHAPAKQGRQQSQAAALVLGLLFAATVPLLAVTGMQTSGHAAHAVGRRTPPGARATNASLSPEEQTAQVLDRFTFGPRPGEVAAVTRMGWATWFEQQLDPAGVADPVADKRLAQYPALLLVPQQLAVQYPDGQLIRRVAEGKAAMPADPQLAGVYQVLLARFQRQQDEAKAEASSAAAAVGGAPAVLPAAVGGAPAAAQAVGTTKTNAVRTPETFAVGAKTNAAATPKTDAAAAFVQPTAAAVLVPLTPAQVETQKQAHKQQQKQSDQAQARMLADQILGDPKNQRMQAIFKLPIEQRMALTSGIVEPEKSMLTNDMTPHERELFGMMAGGYAGSGVIANEMQQAKVLRAVLSERQLLEVMTDFWFNHFNVDLGKNGDMLDYAPSYERDAIRAHALGKFRDLLLATAQHPAMLIYLDNWLSIGPDSQAAGKPRPSAKNQQGRGLNENYGREVMELHTVGVDGGYTQADVTNLAKILTGWTIDQPQMGGNATFNGSRHEPGGVQWFGQQIRDDGMNEGVRALSWLAAQPQTAHLLSYKLAQRFVADAPPSALVDRMAASYLASDGDIKAVLRTMVQAPEFFARADYRNKVKTPLEYVASSLRATGTDPSNPGALVNELKTMGEPLYRCLPPTGYAATADHWMNSSALVDRLNFAIQLTSGKFGGMRFDASRLLAAGLLSRPGQPVPVGTTTHAVALHRDEGQPPPSGQDEALAVMERLLVPGTVSEQTNAVIRRQLALALDPSQPASLAQPANLAGSAGLTAAVASAPMPLPDPSEALDKLAAMILGSPEFQVR